MKVDKLILGSQEHWHLGPEDDCFFFGEYTAHQNFSFSEVNQFVLNFKKSKDREQNAREWNYKTKAIRQAATVLAAGLGKGDNLAAMRTATLVPVPPSKCPTDPMYDDRLLRMLRGLQSKVGQLDIRPLIKQRVNYLSSHSTASRLTPDQLADNYIVDEALAQPAPNSIWIFDDLLVTGAHYRAMVKVLERRFPEAEFVGIFLARRVTED
jgi:hypothetical protein